MFVVTSLSLKKIFLSLRDYQHFAVLSFQVLLFVCAVVHMGVLFYCVTACMWLLCFYCFRQQKSLPEHHWEQSRCMKMKQILNFFSMLFPWSQSWASPGRTNRTKTPVSPAPSESPPSECSAGLPHFLHLGALHPGRCCHHSPGGCWWWAGSDHGPANTQIFTKWWHGLYNIALKGLTLNTTFEGEGEYFTHIWVHLLLSTTENVQYK